MKNKTMLLFAVLIVFLAQQAFAQSLYTYSESVACGNSVCERTLIQIMAGEEKSIDIGGQVHTFKLVRIEKVGDGGYNHYLSIDGSPPMNSWEAERSLDNKFSSSLSSSSVKMVQGSPGTPAREIVEAIPAGQSPPEPDRVNIYLYEDKICAVPDCAFSVELNVYKKWNLVPIHFLQGGTSSSSYVEQALKKGTCKLQDFTAIYGYNPLKKENIRLYTWGKSASELGSALSSFSSYGEAQYMYQQGSEPKSTEGILIGTPFNSVWVHSRAECKLVTEMQHQARDLLHLLTALGEQKIPKPAKMPVERPIGEKETSQPAVVEYITQGFAPGWNFFAGSPDMDGKSLSEIRGSCNIEKAYTFDASSQSWRQLTTGVGISNNFVFKVADRCMLGMPQVAPPEIPT